MKKNIRLFMTAVLLMVAMAVTAQSGCIRLKDVNITLNYSFGGGDFKKTRSGVDYVEYAGEGSSISASASFKAPKNGGILTATVYFNDKNGNTIEGQTIVKKSNPGKSGNLSISAVFPAGATVAVCEVRLGGLYAKATCTKKLKPTNTTSVDLCDCNDSWRKALYSDWTPKFKDCGIRFRDITGDVSVKSGYDDDDAYEAAEFDTILHYSDWVKTEVDSEAILGLADKTSFVIKEKTILIMPEYEGEVSNVKMIAGVIWVNMKKMVNGGELRLDGTQAVAGIRGTIVAMEETGSETKFWLMTGKVDLCAKKTGKRMTLKPGETATIRSTGKIKVQKFNIEQAAKRFGIPMSEINNHSNVGQEFNEGSLNYRIISDKTVEVIGVKGTSKTIQIPAQLKYNNRAFSVVGIAKNAFANQTQLTAVNIPKTVRAIAEDAFINAGLTQVSIPGDKVSIVKNAFRNCKKLTVATVNGKSPQCSPDAFNGCTAMKELRIKGINASNNGKKLNGTNAVIRVIK